MDLELVLTHQFYQVVLGLDYTPAKSKMTLLLSGEGVHLNIWMRSLFRMILAYQYLH